MELLRRSRSLIGRQEYYVTFKKKSHKNTFKDERNMIKGRRTICKICIT